MAMVLYCFKDDPAKNVNVIFITINSTDIEEGTAAWQDPGVLLKSGSIGAKIMTWQLVNKTDPNPSLGAMASWSWAWVRPHRE